LPVHLPLELRVDIVVESNGGRVLHRPRHHQSRVAAHFCEVTDKVRVSAKETGTAACKIRSFGKGVDGDDAI
jgi:hypothetical protein